ncbi:MAG TPA: DUF1566 domain-containing protein [Azospirillum sp.]|nr:DUF1566 domain-containing protein [Azospirillum sp.]
MAFTYTVVDTGQTSFYGNTNTITRPSTGADFHGQDATYSGNQPSYRNNSDGTVSDLNTGLTWAQAPTTSKLTWSAAVSNGESLVLGGHDDWRLPSIKELYSLIKFSGSTGTSAATSTPYIDNSVFGFQYESTSTGSRFIDCQYWSATPYLGTTMQGDPTAFGVNFADGRIKGYPVTVNGKEHTLYALYVRGNTSYGVNDFRDNGDGTVTDLATGLMWAKADSGTGMEWKQALSYAEGATTGGYSDWRLPNAKELESIVDYSRSPAASDPAQLGPAIDPVFSITNIGSAASPDYPYYWSGTTHVEGGTGDYAVYQTVGKAWGFMNFGSGTQLTDVHGAGSQRSDPKTGDASDYPTGHGPQGDVIRVDNYVRVVRDAGSSATAGQSVPGTDAAQTLTAGTGNDTVSAGGGADVVSGLAGRDVLYGEAGADTLWGGDNADVLYGGADADALYGNLGLDTLYGGEAGDVLFGGQGNDLLYGEAGADALYGNLAADVLYGGAEADSLFGGQGNDALYGGDDADVLWGNLGSDTMTGGGGADRFGVGSGADTVTDFSYSEGDRIVRSSGMTWTASDGSGGAVVSLSNGAQVTLTGVKASAVTADWFVTG